MVVNGYAINISRNLTCPRIARQHKNLLRFWRLTHFPRNRMFPPARTNDQYVHNFIRFLIRLSASPKAIRYLLRHPFKPSLHIRQIHWDRILPRKTRLTESVSPFESTHHSIYR